MNCKVVKRISHEYKEKGISIILLLAESHVFLETWPEYKSVFLSVGLCNGKDPLKMVNYICTKIKGMVIKYENLNI